MGVRLGSKGGSRNLLGSSFSVKGDLYNTNRLSHNNVFSMHAVNSYIVVTGCSQLYV